MVYLITDPIFNLHGTPPNCPDSPRRISRIMRSEWNTEELANQLYGDPEIIALRQRGREFVRAFHDPAYVADVEEQAKKLGDYGFRHVDRDTVISRYSIDTAYYAFGRIDDLAAAVVKTGESYFLAVRPAGHHAEHRGSSGYCIFANAAFAAFRMLCRGKRTFVFDFDAHHGNGTQDFIDHAFYGAQPRAGEAARVHDPTQYFFVSVNQEGLRYPAGVDDHDGQNVMIRNLPPGIGDAEFIEFLKEDLRPLLRRFRPEAAVISAGFDMCRHDARNPTIRDALGLDMHLTHKSYAAIRRTFESIPSLYLLEGGYHPRSVQVGVEAICE